MKKTTQEYEWSTARLMNDAEEHASKHELDEFNDFKLSKYGFEKYNLPVTEKEKIIPVINKMKWNIVRVNEDGKVIWQFEGTANDLVGIGLAGSDVIAFYTTSSFWKFKKLTAILISGTKGTKLKENTVYESNSSADRTQVRVQNNANGVFNDVMVITDKRREDPFIQLFFVDTDLSVSKPILLKPTFTFTKFAGSLVNNNGEVLVADFSEDQFIVSKFNKEGKELKKLITPIKRRSDYFTTMLQPDRDNAEAIVIGLKYESEKKDWINQLYRFDMAASKVTSSLSEILEKDYAKSLTLEKIKGVTDGNLKWIDEAEIAGLVQWKDKWVLIKEIRTSVSSDRNTRYINHAWIASIYDTDLKLRKTIGLDKRYESFLPKSLSLGFAIQNDKLLVLAPALTGIGSSAVTFVSVNMQTEQIEKAIALDQVGLSITTAIEAGATLWFNNSFLLQQLKGGSGFMNRTSNCVLNKIEM